MLISTEDVSKVKYKQQNAKRLQNDFKALKQKNPALYTIVTNLAGFCYTTLKKPIIVTHIYRTREEQKKIYGAFTKKKSPHEFYCAVDLRSRSPYLTKDQTRFLENALKLYDQYNKFKKPMANGSKTVWVHEVGDNGIHFHIQYWGPVVGNRFQLPELPSRYFNQIIC